MRLNEQRSIIDDFDIDILTMASTTIVISKFPGSNYKQRSGEMALLVKQKQVYGIDTGKDEQPEDSAEDAAVVEELAHRAAVKDLVKQFATAQSTMLLAMKPWLQALYMVIKDAHTLREKLVTVYKVKLKFNVCQIREELLGIMLEDCDDVDTSSAKCILVTGSL